MSFHFCTHAWEISDIKDGTLILLTDRDLEMATLPLLVDDLLEIVRESGKPNLYLDFSKVQMIVSVVLGKLIAAHEKLREQAGRLILLGLDPAHYAIFQATRLTEMIEIRRPE